MYRIANDSDLALPNRTLGKWVIASQRQQLVPTTQATSRFVEHCGADFKIPPHTDILGGSELEINVNYALYMAIRGSFGGSNWNSWPIMHHKP